jgi:hypothetical protein
LDVSTDVITAGHHTHDVVVTAADSAGTVQYKQVARLLIATSVTVDTSGAGGDDNVHQ